VALSVEPAPSPQDQPRVIVRAWRGDRVAQLEVPRGALVGIQDLERSESPGLEATPDAHGAEGHIRVMTLPDLGLERAQVRRRTDLRGVIEPAARPLVTTRSVASLLSLLR
jgi:hypothetical protein